MTKEQILACMGAPYASASAGGTQVWTYYSSNGVASANGGAIAAGYCKVDVVMTGNRVAHINYSGPTGGLLTKGMQCSYAVDNCMRQ